jgi:hypothetical protein
MRAIKGKDGVLSLISSTEARVYQQVEFDQFTPAAKLSERELHLADELFKRNLLQKENRNGAVGYTVYPQKHKL